MGLRGRGPCEKMAFEAAIPKKLGKRVECEKSVFFFRFSAGSVRERERRAAKVNCVSRTFCSTDQEKRETARSLEKREDHVKYFIL